MRCLSGTAYTHALLLPLLTSASTAVACLYCCRVAWLGGLLVVLLAAQRSTSASVAVSSRAGEGAKPSPADTACTLLLLLLVVVEVLVLLLLLLLLLGLHSSGTTGVGPATAPTVSASPLGACRADSLGDASDCSRP